MMPLERSYFVQSIDMSHAECSIEKMDSTNLMSILLTSHASLSHSKRAISILVIRVKPSNILYGVHCQDTHCKSAYLCRNCLYNYGNVASKCAT